MPNVRKLPYVGFALIILFAGMVQGQSSQDYTNKLVEPGKNIMLYADTSRGRPFSKDPDVVNFKGRYYMYYSIPPYSDGRTNDGWAVGIACSDDLETWKRIGEIGPAGEYEKKGLAAPAAIVFEGKVHLFYQTYGNGPKDAICHAFSEDAVNFERNKTNPIFRPRGHWNIGRAIDADVIADGKRMLLYCATRDPAMKIQMLAVAGAPLDSGFVRDSWKQLANKPILKPELPWEKNCIEAPAVFKHNDRFFMFYAGAYNNQPQQIGCAVSDDGIAWKRISEKPLLPNGRAGQWNESESGHPGVFGDDDGKIYLFFQGNNDNGKTWYISKMKVGWKDDMPFLLHP
ncbi:MAG: family 43 glycosylhydrolase [Sedimentisphaerales bacterium]|nr:family 43 glycosylhydrolase [Sedimentisphaerales bacterium]